MCCAVLCCKTVTCCQVWLAALLSVVVVAAKWVACGPMQAVQEGVARLFKTKRTLITFRVTGAAWLLTMLCVNASMLGAGRWGGDQQSLSRSAAHKQRPQRCQ